MNLCRFLLLILLSLASIGIQADDKVLGKKEQAKLEALQKEIKTLQTTLQARSGERNNLNEELKRHELAVSAISQKIAAHDAQIAALDGELLKLAEQKQTLETQRDAQQQHIAREIDAAYRLGRSEPMKLLLNQEDPDHLTRTLKYYRYFIEARSARIESYRATMAELALVEISIGENQARLAQSRGELDREKLALGEKQEERRKVIAALDQQLGSDQERMAEMTRQSKEIEAIIARLEEAIQDLARPGSDPFPRLRGKLPWPVTGKILKGYGAMRAQNLSWKGWLIGSAEGTPITAVHNGRVVFSDYLRGHGLLLIVDHGDNYLSLYAHNQVLLKEIGDWVRSGDRIALVGKSGGLEDSALYFEIRHNGQPQDPKNWLSRR